MLSADVTYMPGKQSGPVFDPLTNSTQWSRRFIGLKLFLALAELGESGYAEMVEHQAASGRRPARVADGVRMALVNETPLPVVCFTREHLDSRLTFWRRCICGRSHGCPRPASAGLRCCALHHQLPHCGSRYPVRW